MIPRMQKIIDSIPIGRMAKPVEIAKVAMFLASDKASYITGEMVDVNGGIFVDWAKNKKIGVRD